MRSVKRTTTTSKWNRYHRFAVFVFNCSFYLNKSNAFRFSCVLPVFFDLQSIKMCIARFSRPIACRFYPIQWEYFNFRCLLLTHLFGCKNFKTSKQSENTKISIQADMNFNRMIEVNVMKVAQYWNESKIIAPLRNASFRLTIDHTLWNKRLRNFFDTNRTILIPFCTVKIVNFPLITIKHSILWVWFWFPIAFVGIEAINSPSIKQPNEWIVLKTFLFKFSFVLKHFGLVNLLLFYDYFMTAVLGCVSCHGKQKHHKIVRVFLVVEGFFFSLFRLLFSAVHHLAKQISWAFIEIRFYYYYYMIAHLLLCVRVHSKVR